MDAVPGHISERLTASAPAEETLKEVRCDAWRFSLRIPADMSTEEITFGDWYTDEVFAGGVEISAGGDGPCAAVVRRSRIYNVAEYLGGYGDEEDETEIIHTGGRTMYGVRTAVEDGDGAETEFRLIPASDNRGTEFIVRYSAENEAEALALLDTVIRYYWPDEIQTAKADFLPARHEGEPDLTDSAYLLRVEDIDKIPAEGYFTAALYLTDTYSIGDVSAMKPGDTILILDRVLTIIDIESGDEDEETPEEIHLYGKDTSLNEQYYGFDLTLTPDETAYLAYFGEDTFSASRVGEVRIEVAQAEPVAYGAEEGDGYYPYSDDLLGDMKTDPDMLGIGWNEYTHEGFFKDGKLVRVLTWSYPHNPEDPQTAW